MFLCQKNTNWGGVVINYKRLVKFAKIGVYPPPIIQNLREKQQKTREGVLIFSEWYIRGTLDLNSLLFLYRYDRKGWSVSFALFTKYKLVKFLGLSTYPQKLNIPNVSLQRKKCFSSPTFANLLGFRYYAMTVLYTKKLKVHD